MAKTWFKILHTGGATVASTAGSLFSLIITAHVLGPAGRGQYAAVVTWVALFATIGSLSLGQVMIHEVAGRPRDEWLSEMLGTTAALSVATGVLCWLVVLGIRLSPAAHVFGDLPTSLLLLGFVALPALIWSDTARYLLNAMDSLAAANRIQMAMAVLSIISIFLFVAVLRLGTSGAVVTYALTSIVSGGALFVHAARQAGTLRPRVGLARQLLRGSAKLHLNAVGAYLFSQASVLVLNYYRTPAETGYYQLAMQLMGLAMLVSTAIGTVSFGLVAQLGPDRAWPQQRRLLLQSVLVVSAISVVGYLLAPLAIRLVAGASFLPAASLFRIVLPALVGATFSSVMASQWIGRGLFWQAAVTTIGIGIISISLDLVLIPRYGTRGALVSTLVTYGVSVLGNGAMAIWVQRRYRRGLDTPTSAAIPAEAETPTVRVTDLSIPG